MTAAHSYPSNRPGAFGRLFRRELDRYPSTGPRYTYLAIVVVTTVILYYQLYIGGAVATQLLGDYHMTFLYYVTVLVIGNALAAFASLATGVADRIGRANLVVGGTFITSLIALVLIPNAHTKLTFAIEFSALTLVEGIILVATPALVRDFSPQVGRAQAMGFWTMGPVLGSLVVSEVSSHTLSHLHAWQDQFIISGIVGMVITAVALVGLRELSPGLRDQVMVSLQEQAVIEMRARGMDLDTAMRRPYRQMLKPDILASSFAIGAFLALYYTAVAFFPIYFQTVLNFTQSQSNSLLNWYWSFNAISLILFGVLSDRIRVRKPFMLLGSVLSLFVSLVFLSKATANNPTFWSMAILLAFIGVWGGATFGPWMAGFTETVERRNPALTATGLAVWGWILRLIVAAIFLILPHVINSVTPLVDRGPEAQALQAKYPSLVAEAQAHPEVFQSLAKYTDPSQIPNDVLGKALTTVGAPTLQQLQNPDAQAALKRLQVIGPGVQKAQKDAPHQWQHWFWICVAGQILFIPLIFFMAGAWSPRRAKEEQDRQEAIILSDSPSGAQQPA